MAIFRLLAGYTTEEYHLAKLINYQSEEFGEVQPESHLP